MLRATLYETTIDDTAPGSFVLVYFEQQVSPAAVMPAATYEGEEAARRLMRKAIMQAAGAEGVSMEDALMLCAESDAVPIPAPAGFRVEQGMVSRGWVWTRVRVPRLPNALIGRALGIEAADRIGAFLAWWAAEARRLTRPVGDA